MKLPLKIRSLDAVLIAAALLLMGCQKAAPVAAEKADQVVRVGVMTTRLSTFSEVGVYYGKLAGTENATLLSVLGGRVDSIDTTEGSSVASGQSLGKINAEKASSNRDLAALNEKITQESLDRQRQFLQEGNASQISVDQSEMAWLAAKNSLIDAQKALEGALCITPIRGVVTRRFVELHQEVAPGSPTFAVASIDKMKVGIGIPEPEIAGVSLGNEADVTVSGMPGTTWKGAVSRLSREVSQDTLTFEAEVTIDNPGRRLLPGTTASVTVHRRDLTGQILVPTEAVLTSGPETFVMVERGGTVHKTSVVTGPSSRTQTVIAEGLGVGQDVVVAGNNLVADGAAVVVTGRSDQ